MTREPEPRDEHHAKHIEMHKVLDRLVEEFSRHFIAETDLLHTTNVVDFLNWSLSQYFEPDHEHDEEDGE